MAASSGQAPSAPRQQTTSASLVPATLGEVRRILPDGGTRLPARGTSALSAGVVTALTSAGFIVHRLSGPPASAPLWP
ncbi:MAG: hypothetical protein ACRDZY_15095 [Acidimicrobiales bacterium]